MSRRAGAALTLSACLVAGCGTATDSGSQVGADGTVAATPRALAAVVVDHVDPGEPRRSTGGWSDWNDPLALEAQVDYGVDPEGSEDGSTSTVHVHVAERAAFSDEDRAWLRCRRAQDEGRCQEEAVDGGRLLFRWRPGTEEEEGGFYAWTVVRDQEVVEVSYDRSALFPQDPRTLDLDVDPDDLRRAALDPAMSLRTTARAWEEGAALGHYEGAEEPPSEPLVSRTTPRQLADRFVEYLGLAPRSVTRSRLTDFGPDAVGARLEYPANRRHAAFTVDVLTTVGRVPQLDPLPCPVQDGSSPADDCFAWTQDSVATWTLATADRPGTLWVIGAQDDEAFNRVESVGIRVTSDAIDHPFFGEPPVPDGLPPMLLGYLEPLTADLTMGPEQQRAGG